jgi:hypothetical protein
MHTCLNFKIKNNFFSISLRCHFRNLKDFRKNPNNVIVYMEKIVFRSDRAFVGSDLDMIWIRSVRTWVVFLFYV